MGIAATSTPMTAPDHTKAGHTTPDPTASQSAAGGHAMDRLIAEIDRVGSPVCVGVDPVLENLPAALRASHGTPVAAIVEFTHSVLAAAAGAVPAVKFQAACFERYGHDGFAAL